MATNEAVVRLKLHHALQWRGYWPLHLQDGRVYRCSHGHPVFVRPEQKGWPDTWARHPKYPEKLIEVKDVPDTSFAFNEISPEQRVYLTAWAEDGGESYICLGKTVPYGSRRRIHSIHVIPWMEWVTMEEEVKMLLDMKSIPYDYTLYTNKVAAQTSDLVTRFPHYRLEFRDKSWHFRDDHPLAVCAEVAIPYFLRFKETKEAWANEEKAQA